MAEQKKIMELERSGGDFEPSPCSVVLAGQTTANHKRERCHWRTEARSLCSSCFLSRQQWAAEREALRCADVFWEKALRASLALLKAERPSQAEEFVIHSDSEEEEVSTLGSETPPVQDAADIDAAGHAPNGATAGCGGDELGPEPEDLHGQDGAVWPWPPAAAQAASCECHYTPGTCDACKALFGSGPNCTPRAMRRLTLGADQEHRLNSYRRLHLKRHPC
ncbi:unnamed protein product [Symbiodinium natans]|uniref:Uncharacterized protein n=1 Tax=Symbiodinium natans TaxID=878477 RepID=A0A812TDB3_9DINO|nr:unnamed protein product [Symbiodinium natans]